MSEIHTDVERMNWKSIISQ